MSTREKLVVVVLSVVLAVAIALGVGSILFQRLAPGGTVIETGKGERPRGDTDDAPIIMAGGSLHISTGATATLKPGQANKDLLEFTANYRVFQIDVTDFEDALHSVPAAQLATGGSVVLTYCKLAGNNCAAGADRTDTITLTFDNAGAAGPIKLSNNLAGKPVGKMPRVSPYLRTHIRNKWKLLSVTVKVTGMADKVVTCGTDDTQSECYLVVHTCTSADLTTCKPD